MKTQNARLVWTTPRADMLWPLGIGLLAASFLHALIVAPRLNDYAGYDLAEVF